MALISAPEFSFRTRQAHWQFLKSNPNHVHNVLIVGGGIVGAGFARECGLRGITDVLLVEKNDFASGTSGASSKLIHAGIRYLEQSWNRLKRFNILGAIQNFSFVVQASNERKILGEMAPHLIKPKPFYFVIGEKDGRSTFSVLFGVWFYYLIQLAQGQFFSPPRVIIRKSAIKTYAPQLDYTKVKAIFSFWDSETDDARLVIENLQNANTNNIRIMNYVEVVSSEKNKDLWDVTLKNNENQETLTVKVKIIVNASGPFIDEVRKLTTNNPKPVVDRVAGAHLDIHPALTTASYYITASDERLVFVLNRNEDGLNYTRIGTTERPLESDESSDNPQPTQEEMDYLVSLVRNYFPDINIKPEHIVRKDEGIRPLYRQESHGAFQKSREHKIIVDEKSLYHLVGVKLTDFRRVAVELVEKIPWADFEINIKSDFNELEKLRHLNSEKLYAEENMKAAILQTMVLKWEDYLQRRRGLYPRIHADEEKLNFEKVLSEIKDAH